MIDICGLGSSGSAVVDTRWLGHTMALGSEAHGLPCQSKRLQMLHLGAVMDATLVIQKNAVL